VSLLIGCIHPWLNYTTIATADYPAALHYLIQEQTALAGERCYVVFGVPGGRTYKSTIYMQHSNTIMTTAAKSWSPCSAAPFGRKYSKSGNYATHTSIATALSQQPLQPRRNS
jgi:hypothetical protein